MSSLSEMLQYAQAQQPQNGLADVAVHFLQGANSGYDAGHAEAVKNRDNPIITDPITGKNQRLDVVSKLLDVHAKMAAAEEAKLVSDALRAGSADTDTKNRQSTLAQMAQNELEKTAGVAGRDNSEQAKITNVVSNPNPSSRRPGKMTVSLKDGKPSISMDFADPKRTTVDQISAIKNYVDKNGDADSTVALASAFPDGPPDWAAKMMAQSQELKQKKDQIETERHKIYTEKRITSLGESLDPSKARQGAFGDTKKIFDRAERLQSLASQYPDGNLDSRQIEELAIGTNAVLTGSNTGAQEQVKSLVPKSAWGNAQKLTEWLTNNPRGTQQQAFVARMMDTVGREKNTASDQIKRTQFQRATRYGDLEKSNPDEFYNQLQTYGLDPEEYQAWKKNGFKPISAVQKSEDANAKVDAPELGDNEVLRNIKDKTGDRLAVFNSTTKQFLRWSK